LNALKQIDFEQFESIVEVDETYFLYSQKGQRDITGENSVNVAVAPNTEESATSRFVFCC
jgi:hypothetical protein